MISMKELNKKELPVSNIVESNLLTLQNRLNKLREIWGKPMIVTSGLRSEDQQKNLIKSGASTATKSRHLIGAAADISDPEGELKEWLLKPENGWVLETCQLWCEHWDSTPTWVHFQICPPASGSRWFKP